VSPAITIEMLSRPRHRVLDGKHIGATWRIRLNDPCAEAMRSVARSNANAMLRRGQRSFPSFYPRTDTLVHCGKDKTMRTIFTVVFNTHCRSIEDSLFKFVNNKIFRSPFRAILINIEQYYNNTVTIRTLQLLCFYYKSTIQSQHETCKQLC